MFLLSLATCVLTGASQAGTAEVRARQPSLALASRFGRRVDPINGRTRQHRGVDLAARHGAPVYAAAAGRVRYAGVRGSYGNLVEVEHGDGSLSRYAHLSALLVRVGDLVPIGGAIGQIGATGRATGPHLHFELHVRGVAIDPLPCFALGNETVANVEYGATRQHQSAFAAARAKLSQGMGSGTLPTGAEAAVDLK